MANQQAVVVQKNVANVHLEPSGDTELVTQAIAGQAAVVLETRDIWQHVQFADNYRGWIQARFLKEMEQGAVYPAQGPFAVVTALIADLYHEASDSSGLVTKLVLSTRLQCLESQGLWSRVLLPSGAEGWLHTEQIQVSNERPLLSEKADADELVRQARRLIGTPYLWGGTTPFGIDCSGFMQLMYFINGIQLLRDAGIQCRDPRALPVEPSDLQPGDLVYFSSPKEPSSERITHTGMYVGGGEFIHAAGQSVGVTISPLFSGYYWDVFSCARRMPGVTPSASR